MWIVTTESCLLDLLMPVYVCMINVGKDVNIMSCAPCLWVTGEGSKNLVKQFTNCDS